MRLYLYSFNELPLFVWLLLKTDILRRLPLLPSNSHSNFRSVRLFRHLKVNPAANMYVMYSLP